MPDDKYLSYAQSGVSIDANDQMVENISASVANTYGPRVMAMPNGFAGLFRLDYDEKLFKKNYKNPVLIACTDGVGTKILIAQKIKKYDSIGIDLVAMSVNDMIVLGAEPLFFLDYLAVNKLEPATVANMVQGIAKGCKIAGCALIGGETAEMPDLYRKDDFDMAGFAVGVVEKNRIIDGKNIQKGDQILALASNGLHSNGFSLVRKICFEKLNMKPNDRIKRFENKTIAEVLLEPTRIYAQPINKLLSKYKVKKVVHAMAHITGGGLIGNIPRILPDNCNAVIKKNSWQIPDIFKFLQEKGPVTEEEAFRVFNMGIGLTMIVAKDFADSVTKKLTKYGEKVYNIGQITAGSKKVIIK
jgi:phosphoribosylformylglycinamidine cyclo-ligase